RREHSWQPHVIHVHRLTLNQAWVLAPLDTLADELRNYRHRILLNVARNTPAQWRTESGLRLLFVHLVGRVLYRLYDVLIAGAAAEIPLESVADLSLRRIGITAQQVDRGHDHSGRAVAALQ